MEFMFWLGSWIASQVKFEFFGQASPKIGHSHRSQNGREILGFRMKFQAEPKLNRVTFEVNLIWLKPNFKVNYGLFNFCLLL